MTNLAGSAELRNSMIWVGSLVIGSGMTSKASIRRIGIITLMTGSAIAGDRHMSSGKSIVSIMSREGSRLPTGIRCMAASTFIRNTDGIMIRVC